MSKTDQKFQSFEEEASPEDVHDIEQRWLIQSRQRQRRVYTIILFVALGVIGLIFAGVVELAWALQPAPKNQLDDVNSDIQLYKSKYGLRFTAAKGIENVQKRMARNSGVVYPQLAQYLEDTTRSNMKILLIPYQPFGVNFLAPHICSFLVSGHLHVVLSDPLYIQMVNINVNFTRVDAGSDRCPLQVLQRGKPSMDLMKIQDYSLIVIEDGAAELDDIIKNARGRVVILRSAGDTVMANKWKQTNKIYELRAGVKGKDGYVSDILNYAIYPYKAQPHQSRTIYLITPMVYPPQPTCMLPPSSMKPQPNLTIYESPFTMLTEADSNLIEFMRNKTTQEDNVVYWQMSGKVEIAEMIAGMGDAQWRVYALDALQDSIKHNVNKFRFVKSMLAVPKAHKNSFYFIEWDVLTTQTSSLIESDRRIITNPPSIQSVSTLFPKNGIQYFPASSLDGCYYPNPPEDSLDESLKWAIIYQLGSGI